MTEIEISKSLCGNDHCISFLIESGHACRRCAEQLEREEMQAEGEFYRNMGEEFI